MWNTFRDLRRKLSGFYIADRDFWKAEAEKAQKDKLVLQLKYDAALHTITILREELSNLKIQQYKKHVANNNNEQ